MRAGGKSPRLIMKTKKSRKIIQTVEIGAYHHIFRSLEFLGEGRSTMFWSLGRGVKLAMPDLQKFFLESWRARRPILICRGVWGRFLHLRSEATIPFRLYIWKVSTTMPSRMLETFHKGSPKPQKHEHHTAHCVAPRKSLKTEK